MRKICVKEAGLRREECLNEIEKIPQCMNLIINDNVENLNYYDSIFSPLKSLKKLKFMKKMNKVVIKNIKLENFDNGPEECNILYISNVKKFSFTPKNIKICKFIECSGIKDVVIQNKETLKKLAIMDKLDFSLSELPLNSLDCFFMSRVSSYDAGDWVSFLLNCRIKKSLSIKISSENKLHETSLSNVISSQKIHPFLHSSFTLFVKLEEFLKEYQKLYNLDEEFNGDF